MAHLFFVSSSFEGATKLELGFIFVREVSGVGGDFSPREAAKKQMEYGVFFEWLTWLFLSLFFELAFLWIWDTELYFYIGTIIMTLDRIVLEASINWDLVSLSLHLTRTTLGLFSPLLLMHLIRQICLPRFPRVPWELRSLLARLGFLPLPLLE